MLKKLLASSSGDKNGSSNIYMNGKEIYKIYRGQNLVYDVYNGRDFNYSYNYANQKFTFTDWKQTFNGEPNTTHLIVPNDNTVVVDTNILFSYRNQPTHVVIPKNVSMTTNSINELYFWSNGQQLIYADISSDSIINMSNAVH